MYRLRSGLLYLTEDLESQQALRSGVAGSAPASFAQIFDGLDVGVRYAVMRDASGREFWRVVRASGASPDVLQEMGFSGRVVVPLEVRERLGGELLGTVEVEVTVAAFLPFGGFTPAFSGMILGIFDSSTGVSLAPLSLDPALLAASEFTWGGNWWLTTERTLEEPPFRIVTAAPLTPFIEPFQDAARRGAGLVLIVALVGLGMVVLLTNRFARSLKDLSTAAEAVSRGDLTRRVEARSGDEVDHLAVDQLVARRPERAAARRPRLQIDFRGRLNELVGFVLR